MIFPSGTTTSTTFSNVTVTISDGEAANADTVAVPWSSSVAFENWATEDGRFMLPDSLDWREPPLTLMAMVETAEDGHVGAQVAGKMETFDKRPAEGEEFSGADVVEVFATGEFGTEEYGAMIARLVENEELRGVSVDLAVDEWCFRDPETGDLLEPDEMSDDEWQRAFFGELQFAVRKATIMAATVCPTPAFAEARIAITASAGLNQGLWRSEDGSLMTSLWGSIARTERVPLTASAAGLAPLAPPREWFEVPEADEHTPFTVKKNGQAFGHLAPDVCHTAFLSCELPPRSASGYAYFHTGQLETAEGDLLNVGRVTVGKGGSAKGGHASIVLGTQGAMEHYDSTGCTAAFVRASDGKHGVWLAGAVRSDAPAEKVRDLRAHPLSGDWRPEKGGLELVAALAVPVGGFPLPRYEARLVASGGVEEITALIATDRGAEPVSRTRADIRKLAVLGRKAREALSR